MGKKMEEGRQSWKNRERETEGMKRKQNSTERKRDDKETAQRGRVRG